MMIFKHGGSFSKKSLSGFSNMTTQLLQVETIKRLSLRNKPEASWFVILEAREAMWKANTIHMDDVFKSTFFFFFNLKEDSVLWSTDT